MTIDPSEFLNPFDLAFIVITIISIFFGIKNGFIKSLFNLVKWILIFYLIKNCFSLLRPIIDPYITNQTISDILIFLSTLIASYILISSLNRIIIGVLQPKKSGLADLSFGAFLGLFRGYIIYVLLIFFINTSFSSWSLPDFLEKGSFQDVVNYGIQLLDHIQREFDEIENINL